MTQTQLRKHKPTEMRIPALHILVWLFHIWQAESHAQPENVFGPDGIVHGCLTVLLDSSLVESVRIWSSASPTHQSSIHKSETKCVDKFTKEVNNK